MHLQKGKWSYLKDMNLKTKIIISFTLIIVIPISLIGWLYYLNSSSVISDEVGKNVYEIVKKNNQIIDAKLSNITESTLNIPSDPDLYSYFSSQNSTEKVNILELDRRVTKILQKYYLQSKDITSAILATSYFPFGLSIGNRFSATYVSGENYTSSRLYSAAVSAGGSLVWMPTYDFIEMFNQYGLRFNSDVRYVISAVKVLNLFVEDNFKFRVIDPSIEKPVLIVSMQETVLDNVYKGSIPIKGAAYYITTRDGYVVSSGDKSLLTIKIEFPWLSDAVNHGSGVFTYSENGRKYLACYDTSFVTGWISVAVIPEKELMRSFLPTILTYTLTVAGLFILISIPLIYLIASAIFRPMQKLISAMKTMGEGNFNVHIDIERNDELGYFVDKFNLLNEKIKILIEENYEAKLREKETEIMALNLQMNPHFLYNTLNLINWMAIENKQKGISRIIMELSNMLVYTLNHKGDIASLKEDMQWLQCYLHIISCRFENVFDINIDIPEDLHGMQVPKLFLQPFVENAILHGFKSMDNGCIIKISGRIEGENAVFEVCDNGIGMDSIKIEMIMNTETSSIGIKNVDKRIKLLYGQDYGVHIESSVGNGTCITIIIPVVKYGNK